jgi:hypothetical protein
MTRAATILGLVRCPGCRVLLDDSARPVSFEHPSRWWRMMVADSFPTCPRCYVESEADDRLRERCVRRALAWWEMNETLRRYRAAEVTPIVDTSRG